jgi:gluconolactonase
MLTLMSTSKQWRGLVQSPVGPLVYADHEGGWIKRIDRATGDTTMVYWACEGRPLRGPNDVVFDAEGGMWCTDHGRGRHLPVDRGGLYDAQPDGSRIIEAAFPLLGPNGVGLSPDGSSVYVVEPHTGRVWEWELRGPGETKPGATSLGIRAWESLLGGNGLCVVNTDGTGEEFVSIPGDVTTNVCFRGPSLRRAVVTLSGSGRLVEIEWPRSGLELAFPS